MVGEAPVTRQTVEGGPLGGPDTRAQCLGEETGREFKRARQGFDAVMGGGQRHGWGGRVGSDRGKRCVQ